MFLPAITKQPAQPLAPPLPEDGYTGDTLCCREIFEDVLYTDPPSSGDAVFEVQNALTGLGYYRGSIDGIYDRETALAAAKFQSDNGLAADGHIRYHVWLKLISAVEKTSKTAVKKKLQPPDGEVAIVIDTFRRKLIILNDGSPYAEFSIAIGKANTPSPIGNWKVIGKAINWGDGFGTRWMGLNVPWGVYGIHGTNKPWSIGSMASHGCFRMWNRDVETIYPWIKINTPVTVIGNPFGYMSGGYQELKLSDKNSAVTFVQGKLKRLGFYSGKADGIFGPATHRAVIEFQKACGLEQNGRIKIQEYRQLGIWE